MQKLLAQDGDDLGRPEELVFEVDQTLGRSQSAQVCLEDPKLAVGSLPVDPVREGDRELRGGVAYGIGRAPSGQAFACHLVLSATGYEIDGAWAHMTSVQEAILGAVVFVIALVMQAGREIEEDREGFV